MAFPEQKATDLLVQCHRRCCVCHHFCGVKIELDHIVPKAAGGPDDIDNAIPVCFECHSEIHAYNPQHPRGRRFKPEELRHHRDQWIEICRTAPPILDAGSRNGDVGPVQALIDELLFNAAAAADRDSSKTACRFRETQFDRAINEGVLGLLHGGLRQAILQAYVLIGRANHALDRLRHQTDGRRQSEAAADALTAVSGCAEACAAASRELMRFLGHGAPSA